MRYSLWLIPPDPVSGQLQQIINNFAEEHHSPKFEPHLTLVGNFEAELDSLITTTKQLAKDLKPFKLNLGEVSFSTTYFQAVFVRAKATAYLMELNLKFKEALGLSENVFMPHISLWYDSSLDMNKRFLAANSVKLPTSEFLVDKIVIVPSVPDPKDWQHKAEIKLGI